MLASNLALTYVSYPTQVLAKSCKLIPVMLMRIVVLGKSYTLKEYMAVLLITFGISLFMLAPKEGQEAAEEESDSLLGLFLLVISLLLDGYTGPKQERLLTTSRPSLDQMMFGLNVGALGILSVALVVTGQLWSGITFLQTYPQIIPDIIYFCISFTFGQYIILMALFRFDSLVLVTITTTRKFFSILGSVISYGHVVTLLQWGGVSLVFSGLIIDTFNKQDKKSAPPDKKTKQKRLLYLCLILVTLQLVIITLWYNLKVDPDEPLSIYDNFQVNSATGNGRADAQLIQISQNAAAAAGLDSSAGVEVRPGPGS